MIEVFRSSPYQTNKTKDDRESRGNLSAKTTKHAETYSNPFTLISIWQLLITFHQVWGSRCRQESPYPSWRSAQARYGPQRIGRSAGGSARDKGWKGRWGSRREWRSRSKENRTLHAWMRWHAQHHWAMRCNVWIMTTRTWLTNKRTAHPRVSVHVRCVEGVQGPGGHVVIGVVRCHHADGIPSTDFFPSGFCSSLLYLQSDCILWSSILTCSQLLHTFASRKRVIWGVVFTHPSVTIDRRQL